MGYNDFDAVAGYYDLLARLVFGRAIDRSQEAHIHSIPTGGKVVILGGGTGRILEYLYRTRPDIRVTFVDASARMLALAKRRSQLPGIEFIHGTENSLPEGRFDVAMAPFFLDMFPDERMSMVITEVSRHLGENSQWIISDFVYTNHWWQRAMLWVMFAFFRKTTGILTDQLPDWNNVMLKSGWRKKESSWFYAGFIEAARFER